MKTHQIESIVARYGLVMVIAWFGLMKFTNYEAQGIAPLVSESPFMSWLYDVLSVYSFSVLLGVFEVTAAVLIAVEPWWPRPSAAGSALAILLFLATISFLFTTPGVFEKFPLLPLTGGFLIKDVTLLGISVWTLADALRATRSSLAGSSQVHAT